MIYYKQTCCVLNLQVFIEVRSRRLLRPLPLSGLFTRGEAEVNTVSFLVTINREDFFMKAPTKEQIQKQALKMRLDRLNRCKYVLPIIKDTIESLPEATHIVKTALSKETRVEIEKASQGQVSTSTVYALLAWICLRLRSGNDFAAMSIEVIAESILNVSESSIRRAIKVLEITGIIERFRVNGKLVYKAKYHSAKMKLTIEFGKLRKPTGKALKSVKKSVQQLFKNIPLWKQLMAYLDSFSFDKGGLTFRNWSFKVAKFLKKKGITPEELTTKEIQTIRESFLASESISEHMPTKYISQQWVLKKIIYAYNKI